MEEVWDEDGDDDLAASYLKSTVEIGTVVTSLTEIVAGEKNQKAFGETATAVMDKVAEIQLKNADDASKAEGFATGDKDEIKQLVTAAEGATKGVDLTDDEVDELTEVCDFISTFVGEQLDEATADMGEKTPESVLTGIATVGAFGTTFVDEIEEDIGFSDISEFIETLNTVLTSTVVVDFVAKGTVDTFPSQAVADVFAAAAQVDVSKVTVFVTPYAAATRRRLQADGESVNVQVSIQMEDAEAAQALLAVLTEEMKSAEAATAFLAESGVIVPPGHSITVTIGVQESILAEIEVPAPVRTPSPPPSPPPSPGAPAVLVLTFDLEPDEVGAPGSEARREFEEELAEEIRTLLGASVDEVQVVSSSTEGGVTATVMVPADLVDRLLDLLADDKNREDLEWLADLLTVLKEGEIVLAVKQTEGQAAEDVKDAIMDTMEENLELLGLLALLLLLIPLCFIFFVCCVYSGHTDRGAAGSSRTRTRTSSRGTCLRTLAPRCVPSSTASRRRASPAGSPSSRSATSRRTRSAPARRRRTRRR